MTLNRSTVLCVLVGVVVGVLLMAIIQTRYRIAIENKGNTLYKLDKWTGDITKCVNSSEGVYFDRYELEQSSEQLADSFESASDKFFTVWLNTDHLSNIKNGGDFADKEISRLISEGTQERESLKKQLQEHREKMREYFTGLRSDSMICKKVAHL